MKALTHIQLGLLMPAKIILKKRHELLETAATSASSSLPSVEAKRRRDGGGGGGGPAPIDTKSLTFSQLIELQHAALELARTTPTATCTSISASTKAANNNHNNNNSNNNTSLADSSGGATLGGYASIMPLVEDAAARALPSLRELSASLLTTFGDEEGTKNSDKRSKEHDVGEKMGRVSPAAIALYSAVTAGLFAVLRFPQRAHRHATLQQTVAIIFTKILQPFDPRGRLERRVRRLFLEDGGQETNGKGNEEKKKTELHLRCSSSVDVAVCEDALAAVEAQCVAAVRQYMALLNAAHALFGDLSAAILTQQQRAAADALDAAAEAAQNIATEEHTQQQQHAAESPVTPAAAAPHLVSLLARLAVATGDAVRCRDRVLLWEEEEAIPLLLGARRVLQTERVVGAGEEAEGADNCSGNNINKKAPAGSSTTPPSPSSPSVAVMWPRILAEQRLYRPYHDATAASSEGHAGAAGADARQWHIGYRNIAKRRFGSTRHGRTDPNAWVDPDRHEGHRRRRLRAIAFSPISTEVCKKRNGDDKKSVVKAEWRGGGRRSGGAAENGEPVTRQECRLAEETTGGQRRQRGHTLESIGNISTAIEGARAKKSKRTKREEGKEEKVLSWEEAINGDCHSSHTTSDSEEEDVREGREGEERKGDGGDDKGEEEGFETHFAVPLVDDDTTASESASSEGADVNDDKNGERAEESDWGSSSEPLSFSNSSTSSRSSSQCSSFKSRRNTIAAPSCLLSRRPRHPFEGAACGYYRDAKDSYETALRISLDISTVPPYHTTQYMYGAASSRDAAAPCKDSPSSVPSSHSSSPPTPQHTNTPKPQITPSASAAEVYGCDGLALLQLAAVAEAEFDSVLRDGSDVLLSRPDDQSSSSCESDNPADELFARFFITHAIDVAFDTAHTLWRAAESGKAPAVGGMGRAAGADDRLRLFLAEKVVGGSSENSNPSLSTSPQTVRSIFSDMLMPRSHQQQKDDYTSSSASASNALPPRQQQKEEQPHWAAAYQSEMAVLTHLLIQCADLSALRPAAAARKTKSNKRGGGGGGGGEEDGGPPAADRLVGLQMGLSRHPLLAAWAQCAILYVMALGANHHQHQNRHPSVAPQVHVGTKSFPSPSIFTGGVALSLQSLARCAIAALSCYELSSVTVSAVSTATAAGGGSVSGKSGRRGMHGATNTAAPLATQGALLLLWGSAKIEGDNGSAAESPRNAEILRNGSVCTDDGSEGPEMSSRSTASLLALTVLESVAGAATAAVHAILSEGAAVGDSDDEKEGAAPRKREPKGGNTNNSNNNRAHRGGDKDEGGKPTLLTGRDAALLLAGTMGFLTPTIADANNKHDHLNENLGAASPPTAAAGTVVVSPPKPLPSNVRSVVDAILEKMMKHEAEEKEKKLKAKERRKGRRRGSRKDGGKDKEVAESCPRSGKAKGNSKSEGRGRNRGGRKNEPAAAAKSSPPSSTPPPPSSTPEATPKDSSKLRQPKTVLKRGGKPPCVADKENSQHIDPKAEGDSVKHEAEKAKRRRRRGGRRGNGGNGQNQNDESDDNEAGNTNNDDAKSNINQATATTASPTHRSVVLPKSFLRAGELPQQAPRHDTTPIAPSSADSSSSSSGDESDSNSETTSGDEDDNDDITLDFGPSPLLCPDSCSGGPAAQRSLLLRVSRGDLQQQGGEAAYSRSPPLSNPSVAKAVGEYVRTNKGEGASVLVGTLGLLLRTVFPDSLLFFGEIGNALSLPCTASRTHKSRRWWRNEEAELYSLTAQIHRRFADLRPFVRHCSALSSPSCTTPTATPTSHVTEVMTRENGRSAATPASTAMPLTSGHAVMTTPPTSATAPPASASGPIRLLKRQPTQPLSGGEEGKDGSSVTPQQPEADAEAKNTKSSNSRRKRGGKSDPLQRKEKDAEEPTVSASLAAHEPPTVPALIAPAHEERQLTHRRCSICGKEETPATPTSTLSIVAPSALLASPLPEDHYLRFLRPQGQRWAALLSSLPRPPRLGGCGSSFLDPSEKRSFVCQHCSETKAADLQQHPLPPIAFPSATAMGGAAETLRSAGKGTDRRVLIVTGGKNKRRGGAGIAAPPSSSQMDGAGLGPMPPLGTPHGDFAIRVSRLAVLLGGATAQK